MLLGLLVGAGSARALIAFGGDAGAMVLGTMLMSTMFSGESSPFRGGALRWGLLVVGAGAFSDVAWTWWAARRDPGEIPLGQFESGGLSDASVLVETYGWTEQALIGRYLAVAGICSWRSRCSGRSGRSGRCCRRETSACSRSRSADPAQDDTRPRFVLDTRDPCEECADGARAMHSKILREALGSRASGAPGVVSMRG